MGWHTMRDVRMLRALRIRAVARKRQFPFGAKVNLTPTLVVQLCEPNEVKARERLHCTIQRRNKGIHA